MPYRATNLKYVSESKQSHGEGQVIFLLFLLFLIILSQIKVQPRKIGSYIINIYFWWQKFWSNGLSVDDTQKNQRASTDQVEFQKNGWPKFVGSDCFQNQVQPPHTLQLAKCLLLKSSRLSSENPLQFGVLKVFLNLLPNLVNFTCICELDDPWRLLMIGAPRRWQDSHGR